MSDQGHKKTDEVLKNLEKKLTKIYKQAYKEIEHEYKQVRKILDQYNGTMSDKERANLWYKYDRLEKMLGQISQEIQNVNKLAVKMINDEMLNVYSLNHDYGAYLVESLSGRNMQYTLYNKATIKKIVADEFNPFTKIAINSLKDKNQIYRELEREFMTAIIKGDGIREISKRIQKVLEKNLYDSVRIARTETTRLESIGRQDAFIKGTEMGIKLKKKWIATMDKRTRETHLELNGKEVELEEEFGYGLQYPGDYNAGASEVINCRCSHIVEFVGLEKSAQSLELDTKLEKMEFDEWLRRH